MKEATPNDAEIPPRGKVKDPFCQIGNHDFDVFLPIIGADCFTIYAHFVRRVFRDPKLKHSIRDLADATGIAVTTASRCLEILGHLRLVKLVRFGGSKDSECELKDSWVVANRLGAIYDSRTLSYSLPPEVAERLKTEVKLLRNRQQGKSSPIVQGDAPLGCGNPALPVSQRNTGVSPATHQRSTKETQTGTHPIWEERRIIEEVPSPTPSQDGEAQKGKDSPDEDQPDGLLKWATAKFIAVINELEDYLFDTSRPPDSCLKNGAQEAKNFGFASLAVEAAQWRGKVLVLTLSANDTAAAQRGLHKYRKKWAEALRKWYQCGIAVEWTQTHRNWWPAER
jgi:hypothetical protein